MSQKNTSTREGAGSWRQSLQASCNTPLGMIGIGLTTIFFVLSVLGLTAHATGMVDNPYTLIITLVLFPLGMVLGLLLVPLAAIMKKRKIFSETLTREGFIIDLGCESHRKIVLLVLVLTVVNVVFFATVAYKGYEFMDTPAFCGTVCHTVMAPEYAAHMWSPHANVACVECHMSPGFSGFVKAKFSGLDQLKGILTGKYSRPIPTPVKGLPPAAVTCEKCHNPERFLGEKKKIFLSYTNDDQKTPQKQDIVLHLGGHNPSNGLPEGIHWHAGHDTRIEYQPLNEDRTKIGTVRLMQTGGSAKIFVSSNKGNGPVFPFRQMDCIDCHNRPAHTFESVIERVDFGLSNKKISADIPGIRQDCLTVLQTEYTSRDEAKKNMLNDLLRLQLKRNGEDFIASHKDTISTAASYLMTVYLDNVWPAMKITWGTYHTHIGHRVSQKGYGCFRCHDEQHTTTSGETISQDCGLCHKEPD